MNIKKYILVALTSIFLLSCDTMDKDIEKTLESYPKLHYEKAESNPLIKNQWVAVLDTIEDDLGDKYIFYRVLDFDCDPLEVNGTTYEYTNFGKCSEKIYYSPIYKYDLEFGQDNGTYSYIYKEKERMAFYQKSGKKYSFFSENYYEISNDSLFFRNGVYVNEVIE